MTGPDEIDEIDEECIRTVERGSIDPSIRLSRRHRWKPLAVTVRRGEAVVLVATRAKRIDDVRTMTIRYRRVGRAWERSGHRRDVHVVVEPVPDGVVSAEWPGPGHAVVHDGIVRVVWRGRRSPRVRWYDSDGAAVGEVHRPQPVRSHHRRWPWWVRVRLAVLRRRHPGEWVNLAPRRRR